MAGVWVSQDAFDWCRRIATERGLGDTFDRLMNVPVVRTPECRTHDGRPNWCDVHGDRRHVNTPTDSAPTYPDPRRTYWPDNTP